MIQYEVQEGDCLERLRELPDASFDCVATDPPYGINTKSDGRGKIQPWGDLLNAAIFYERWIGQCRRLLKTTGSLWVCTSWRTFATMQRTSALLKWPITSLLVWDKCWIGPGGPVGLRPSYELVCLWAMPDFRIENRGVPDIFRCKWAGKKKHHPAEKPVDLMRFCLQHGSQPADCVLDPFTGSGSTGVACVLEGRYFLGIEREAEFVELARRHIEEAQACDS